MSSSMSGSPCRGTGTIEGRRARSEHLHTSSREFPVARYGPTCRIFVSSPFTQLIMPARRAPSSSRSAPSRGPRGARPAEDNSASEAPHGSRPEQVYQRLRDLIVQGLLAPGSRVVETEVAARLGVSRTPV